MCVGVCVCSSSFSSSSSSSSSFARFFVVESKQGEKVKRGDANAVERKYEVQVAWSQDGK